ncbi:uncharacterized protein TNCV_4480511 [Trichonephila clavipes]|nr:uncharacterized protein TNCV_4480511 [Trichonephila clavipes]
MLGSPLPSESQVLPLMFYKLGKYLFSVSQALGPYSPAPPLCGGLRYATEMQTLHDALFICYKQSLDNAHSVPFSQLSSSPLLIQDDTFNDSDIINNLTDYREGQEESDPLRADKNIQGSSFPTNWKSIFLK